MDKWELSFIEQTERFHASGGDLNTFVRVSLGVDICVSIEVVPQYGETRLCFACPTRSSPACSRTGGARATSKIPLGSDVNHTSGIIKKGRGGWVAA